MVFGFMSEIEDVPVTVVVASETYELFQKVIDYLKKSKLHTEHGMSDGLLTLTHPDFRPFKRELDIFYHRSVEEREQFVEDNGIILDTLIMLQDKVLFMEQQKDAAEESARYQAAYSDPSLNNTPTLAQMAGIDIDNIDEVEINESLVKQFDKKRGEDAITLDSFETFDGDVHVVTSENDSITGNSISFKGVKFNAGESDETQSTPAGDFSADDFSNALSNLSGEKEEETPVAPKAFSMEAFKAARTSSNPTQHYEVHPVLNVSLANTKKIDDVVADENHFEIVADFLEFITDYATIPDVIKLSEMVIKKDVLVNGTFELASTIETPDELDSEEEFIKILEDNIGKFVYFSDIGLSTLDRKETSTVFHLNEEEGAGLVLYRVEDGELLNLVLITFE